MTEERRLYRSRDSLIAGVCAGVADYFSVDPLVVRILAVVFTLASGGVLGIAYLALWMVVPKAPKVVRPFEVKPQAVHSDTYGAVDCGTGRSSGRQDAPRSTSAAQAASRCYTAPTYAGAAHVPPEPPAAAPVQRPPQPPLQPPVAPPKEASKSGVKVALLLGSFLLFVGVVAVATMFVEDISWWQYAPLFCVILGIFGMVVPGEPGHLMSKFVGGLILFFVGLTMLTMSLGLVAWESIHTMVAAAWPLLLMMLGFAVVANALKSPVCTLLAGTCFAAFCVIGLLWFSIPGDTSEIVFTAPYGRVYHFEMLLDDPQFQPLDREAVAHAIRVG